MKTKGSTTYAIDFFCGAGGLTKGLLNAGIEVLLGIDADDRCAETYTTNNSVPFLARDVSKMSPAEVKKHIRGIPRSDLLFAACAPCQPFSKQRCVKRSGLDTSLLSRFALIVRDILPGHVLIENVPGLTKVAGYSAYRRLANVLRDAKYRWSEGVLDAKHFGVPQTRRRFVLMASRFFKPSLPSPTHGPNRLPFVTVREAIKRYPPIRQGQKHREVPNHEARSLSVLNLSRIKLTPKNGGDRRSWPARLQLECHKGNYDGHTDVYGRMWWDRAAPALTCRCGSLSNGRYGHPHQNRAISLREAASLQSFPDDYVFYGGSIGHLSGQIGNAVPVRLAEALAHHMIQLSELTERKTLSSRAKRSVGTK